MMATVGAIIWVAAFFFFFAQQKKRKFLFQAGYPLGNRDSTLVLKYLRVTSSSGSNISR
jgi:hypothetical protein